MPDAAQVSLLLAQYAFLGIVPVVIPPFIFTVKTPIEGWITQTETDLAHIRGLASQNGYVFYLEPGPLPGQSLAYFGPDVRIPLPQPALSVNMDGHTNVESLSFSLDGLARSGWRSSRSSIRSPAACPCRCRCRTSTSSSRRSDCGPLPPAKIVFDGDSAGLVLRGSPQAGDRARDSIVGADHRQRIAQRVALRPDPARADARRRARRRHHLRRPVLRGQRHAQHQARASTSRTSRCRATA